LACASHSPLLQLALASPVTVTLGRSIAIWFSHAESWLWFTLTNCPLHTRAPPLEHDAEHPPVSIDWQLTKPLAWQLMSQLALAEAEQLPWQAAWQPPVHVGGEAVHDTLQRALTLAWHWAVQVVMSSLEAHWLVQVPMAWASQLPWQSNEPAVQLVLQLASHDVLQLASTLTLQPPMQPTSSEAEHDASNATGVHCAMQSGGSTVQLAVDETSTLPQAGRKLARAEPAVNVRSAANAVAATAVSERR